MVIYFWLIHYLLRLSLVVLIKPATTPGNDFLIQLKCVVTYIWRGTYLCLRLLLFWYHRYNTNEWMDGGQCGLVGNVQKGVWVPCRWHLRSKVNDMGSRTGNFLHPVDGTQAIQHCFFPPLSWRMTVMPTPRVWSITLLTVRANRIRCHLCVIHN